MHGSTLLRGKLAICNHRLTKHSSCGKLSEQIDIAAVLAVGHHRLTKHSPCGKKLYFRTCEAFQANVGRQSRRGGEREKRAAVRGDSGRWT